MQPYGCGKIMVKEDGENLGDLHISKTQNECLNVKNSVLKTENSSSDCAQYGKSVADGFVKSGECTKTLDSQNGGKNLRDTQISKTLDESLNVANSVLKTENTSCDSAQCGQIFYASTKIEGGECSKSLDSQTGSEILGDDRLKKILDDLGGEVIKGKNLGDNELNKTFDDFGGEKIGGENLGDNELHKTVDDLAGAQNGVENLGDEGKWRTIPRNFWRPNYHLYYCSDCGCERSMFRDPFMKEPPCRCRDCGCFRDRIVVRNHPRRHGRTRNLLSNKLHPLYSVKDRIYGTHGGFSTRRPQFEPEPELEPCPVGAGLANLGNTCFLNSIMQCFTHTVVLVEGLLSLKHDASSHVVGEFCVLCAVREQVEYSFVKSGCVIEPSNLVDNLSNISSFFQKSQQEDAHEFLLALLDKLDSNWSKYEASAYDALYPSSPSEALVQRTFGGRLVSQNCCCKCGHSSDTLDPILDLSLEIEEADSLESALESFTKVEILEDTNSFKCGNCNELVKAEKQLLLDQAPLVAALHLKRFKNDGIRIEKIDKMVKYPLELDLAPYTKGSNDGNEDMKYELLTFVVHVGLSATSGHYFCYIRTSPEEWYRFDDSKVTRVSEDNALRQDAYILFYTKKGTRWFSTLFDKWKEECSEKILSTSPKSVLNVMDLSNRVGSSVHGCDPGGDEDVICENSTASPSELRQDEIETEVGVGKDLHGSTHKDGSRDASIVPASEPMQEKFGSMADFDAWDSSVSKSTSATSLCIYEVKKNEAELDDT